jgi:lantibiotic modifying enzyme
LTSPSLAVPAVAAAQRLAEPIRALPARSLDRSLAAGAAGLAVCFARLASVTGEGRDATAAERYLSVAVDQVATDPLAGGLGLFAGLAGVAWAELAVARALGDRVEPNDDLDALLADVLERRPWPAAWDLVSGLVGIGVYALARPPGVGPDLVAAVVRALAPVLQELAWATDCRLTFGDAPVDGRPRRYLDLGLAHGLPGAIALLAAAARLGCGDALTLLPDAVTAVLAHELPGDAGPGRFPALAWPGGPCRATRVAWCYGDLGVAWALLAAGHLLSTGDASAAGGRALAAAAARSAERSGVVDHGLCHGTAGVALLLHRLATATGDTSVAAAAASWGARLTGAAASRLPAAPGLLEGRAGMVLALLALAGPDTGSESFLLVDADLVRSR